MLKVMRVIKEAHNIERKRRQTTRKKKCDETVVRKQKAKTLISMIRMGERRKKKLRGDSMRYLAEEVSKRLRRRRQMRR